MDFTLSEEQKLVQSTARSFFEKECGSELVRAAWDDPSRASGLTQQLNDWLALAAGDLVDIVLFVEEHGRAVAPGPFFASLLAAQVAAAAGIELSGTASVAVSGGDGVWMPNDERVKHFVPSALEVDEIVVIGGTPAAPTLWIVDAAGVSRSEVDQMDRLRRQYRVEVGGGPTGQLLTVQEWRHAVERVLVTCAAELIGVARWSLDTAIAYAKERVQFERPIGSFQGLQWKLVDASLGLERAAAAVAYAGMCVDADDPDRHRAVHGAKAEAGRAARACTRTSLQVLGGIGFTWEHDLHLRLRRAYAGDAFMGGASHHSDRLAELLFDA